MTHVLAASALPAARIAFAGEGPIDSPGQAVVFYDGDEVLGGGRIVSAETAGSTGA